MCVRKELLERELSKLGLRKTAAQAACTPHEAATFQQQADSGSSHPQADNGLDAEHGS